MFFTMVILAAFSILYTYLLCSFFDAERAKMGIKYVLPSLQTSILPQRRWETFGVGCWHSTTPNTTTFTNHLQPRKRVWTMLWLSTPSTLITTDMTPTSKSVVPGTTALSDNGSAINLISNENEADAFVAKIQAKPAFPIFAPPGPCPSCTRGGGTAGQGCR
jgi:hypothetical protein